MPISSKSSILEAPLYSGKIPIAVPKTPKVENLKSAGFKLTLVSKKV